MDKKKLLLKIREDAKWLKETAARLEEAAHRTVVFPDANPQDLPDVKTFALFCHSQADRIWDIAQEL